MPLKHEAPLRDPQKYDPLIGGSAGPGTHGGTDVDRPPNMPAKGDCDVVASDPSSLVDAVTTDGMTVYVDGTIDMTAHVNANGGVDTGSGITMVGGYCDPDVEGRGSEIVCDTNGHRLFTSCYGKAPTLYGVSFRGPETEYRDPDHTADDFDSKQSTAFYSYDDNGLFTVVGCEFYGWTMAGLEVGAKSHETDAEVRRCSFHENQMEHLGYGIEHYNGFMSVKDSFFDKCRHAISSFGYETGGYAVATCVFGPGPWSGHTLDMHGLANNIDTDSNVAGKFVRVYQSTIMGIEDIGGYHQEGLAIRGVPAAQKPPSYVDASHFFHREEPSPTGEQGDAFRQETDEWKNFEPRDNHFGPEHKAGYGAPIDHSMSNDKPAEDDTTKDKQNPDAQPTGDRTMTVHGEGEPVNYEIVVDGSVKKRGTTEKQESIERNGDGTVTVTGEIVGHTDGFTLSGDAKIVAAARDGPMRITDNGTELDLGMLQSAWAMRKMSQLGDIAGLAQKFFDK